MCQTQNQHVYFSITGWVMVHCVEKPPREKAVIHLEGNHAVPTVLWQWSTLREIMLYLPCTLTGRSLRSYATGPAVL